MKVTTTEKVSQGSASVRDIRIAALRIANFLAEHPNASAVKVSLEGVRTQSGPVRGDKVSASAIVTEHI